MTSREMHEAVHQAGEEVSRRLISGELDGSGSFQTDGELAAGGATRGDVRPAKAKSAPVA